MTQSTAMSAIIVFSLIPVLTMFAGGVIAIFRPPNGYVKSLILHFAAGVVFSVVAVEILPDIIKQHAPMHVIAGFSAGLASMLAIRFFLENKEKVASSSTNGVPFSFLATISVDIVIDGLLLGIGFSAGSEVGTILAIALAVELLSLGLATATELNASQVKRSRAITIMGGLAALFFVGVAISRAITQVFPESSLSVLLAFSVAALLFLVTEELLVEAHEEEETLWHTTAFFIGFLIFLMVGMLI